MDEARAITDQTSLAKWVRSQSKHAPQNSDARDMTNYVPGTEHPTWMSYTMTERGVVFSISTDGADTLGVAGIVVRALNGLTAQEIRATDFSEFRDIARYLNNRQQRTLNALLNQIKSIIGDSKWILYPM